jgi:hypothetical protein
MKKQHSATAVFRGEATLKVDAVIGKTVRDNGEIWRVSSNGQIKNITTTASSTAAMDEAMEIYGRALERLANR